MKFVDEVTIHVAAGAGGDGAVAWHREPYKPKGGPDGGDGGDGGSIILRADPSVGTLLELRDHPHIKAARGGHGEGKRRHGSRGRDRIVLVPPGTVVHEGDVLVADLAASGDTLVAARGGRGGRGNAQFVTSTRRAPGFAEKGEPGEEARLRLELRLLADVALVGFPNAGKSTLISRISAARPKIADYPFTTLQPNLGVVGSGDQSFVVADIPGLIPGAHSGKGLGDRFLRHIRRAALLVFLVDLTAEDRDPARDVDALSVELERFDPELATRPRLIVLNKLDAARDRLEAVRKAHPDALPISAVTGEGIDDLLRRLAREVSELRETAPQRTGYLRTIVRPDEIRVTRENESWRVTGVGVERAVAMTDLDNDEAVRRLQRRLISMGVERELERRGARRGDEVLIGSAAFDFEPESAMPSSEVPE
ncbi:MAG: GTPase ObgE [Actinomycetota bacterium]|nr:GTPase ObgE [Actinomycetota bacterium]